MVAVVLAEFRKLTTLRVQGISGIKINVSNKQRINRYCRRTVKLISVNVM